MSLADLYQNVVPSASNLENLLTAMAVIGAVAVLFGGGLVLLEAIYSVLVDRPAAAAGQKPDAASSASVQAATQEPTKDLPRPFGAHDAEWQRAKELARERRRRATLGENKVRRHREELEHLTRAEVWRLLFKKHTTPHQKATPGGEAQLRG